MHSRWRREKGSERRAHSTQRETPSFTVGGIFQLVGQTLIILGCIAFTTCPVGDYDLDEAKSETKRRCLAIILLLYLVHAYFEGAPYLDVINSGFLFVGLFGSKRGLGSLLTAWMVRCLLSTALCVLVGLI